MRRTIRAVLSAGAAAILLASCSNENPGDPTSGDSSTPKSSSSRNAGPNSEKPSSTGAAPEVTGPELSVDQFSSNPCQALTSEQLTTLGVSPEGSPRNNNTGADCRWRPESLVKGTSYTVNFPPKGTTLDTYYENKNTYPVFEETEVADYPAANFDITDAKSGACSTIVGVAKDAAFMVQVNAGIDAPQYSTPCTLSAKAAEMVLDNLKGGR